MPISKEGGELMKMFNTGVKYVNKKGKLIAVQVPKMHRPIKIGKRAKKRR